MELLRAQLQSALAGRYAIERELGRGGMATVYLARDVKHQRFVALKVLDPELGAVLGAERFLAEIRVTANLQHPHLLPLHDSGEAEGLLFYVMPYVEGESLRARLDRERQLPVDEAVRIATAVASALDYAHRQGVIHRDLKPENILLHDGQPVVADFGIALAVSNAGGQRVTQTGLSLGTPQYMSPEQATGDRVIDGRTDVYSLGAVAYEMLTGEPPHAGATAQAVIARLMTEEPRPLTVLRRAVPPHVDAAVRRALEKLPADRFATAREFADALSGSQPRAGGNLRPYRETLDPRGRGGDGRVRRALPWLVATLSLATTVVAVATRPKPAPATHARFVAANGDSIAIRINGRALAVAPDESRLVYVVGDPDPRRRLLHERRFDDLTPRPIAGTEDATDPQFSPDGRWLAFRSGGGIRKMLVAGGVPETVTDTADHFSWGDRDVVVFSKLATGASGLWRVDAAGGTPVRVTTPAAGRGHVFPELLPGGKAVVFSIISPGAGAGEWELAAARLADGKVIPLGIKGAGARYVASGHLVYGQGNGTLLAVRFDPRTLAVTGTPVQVASGVASAASGVPEFVVTPAGTLAYVPGDNGWPLVQADRAGHEAVLLKEPRTYLHPNVSPDGRRVALGIVEQNGGRRIWLYDIPSGTLSRLTNGPTDLTPAWSPDGRRVAWTKLVGGVWWQPWDGSRPAERLTTDTHGFAMPPSGDRFLTEVHSGAEAAEIVAVTLDSARTRTPVLPTPSTYPQVRFSPDGRWIAYVATRTGRTEVYVQPFPGPGGVRQVSDGGGFEPVWGASARELFYRTPGRKLIAATLAPSGGALEVGRRDTLFTMAAPYGGVEATYAAFPDGKRFVYPLVADGLRAPIVVLGWGDELRAKMNDAGRK